MKKDEFDSILTTSTMEPRVIVENTRNPTQREKRGDLPFDSSCIFQILDMKEVMIMNDIVCIV